MGGGAGELLHHASEIVLADVVNLRLRRRWRLLLLHRHLPSSGAAGDASSKASFGGHGRVVGEGGLVEGALADALADLVDAQVVAGPIPLHVQRWGG